MAWSKTKKGDMANDQRTSALLPPDAGGFLPAKHALPVCLHLPDVAGEIQYLRPATLTDLDAIDALDAFAQSSVVTGRCDAVERGMARSWVRDSVAWQRGTVDVEAALDSQGRTRTIAWTMVADGLAPTEAGTADNDREPIIGMVFLTMVDAWSRSARIQVILGKSFRSRGYSRDAMPRVMTYGFAASPVGLGLHRISIVVPELNARAISVYQSLGFTREASLREALWDSAHGRWQDQVVLSMLADEYDPVAALGAFGMKIDPDNPGVAQALGKRGKSGPAPSQAFGRASAAGGAESVGAGSEASDASAAADADDADDGPGWQFPRQRNGEAKSGVSKLAWWRRFRMGGHGKAKEQPGDPGSRHRRRSKL